MLTRHILHRQLVDAGVDRGGVLVVHASFRSIGSVDGGPRALLEGLLTVVGSDGVLVMPSFTYSNDGKPFDPIATPSKAGVLSELLRQTPGSVRSLHPTHSVVALGKDARALVQNHLHTGACGIGSPLDLAARRNAHVLLLGVTHTSNTMIHVGESYARIKKFPSWQGPPPEYPVVLPDGAQTFCKADTSSSCSFAFNALDLELRRRHAVQDLCVGTALCELMRARMVIAATVELLRREPESLCCTRPDCLRCQRRLAYLREEAGKGPEPLTPPWSNANDALCMVTCRC